MTGLPAVLLSLGVALVVTVVSDLVSEEARGWFERLPYGLIRLAARRLPERDRAEYTEEWVAELTHVLTGAGRLPITRLVKGMIFAAGLIGATYQLAKREPTRLRYRLEVTTAEMLDSDHVEGRSFTNVALINAVKQLGPEQQECIVLRFLQGLSVAETARIMGRNEGAVTALQYRAVRALARMLPDESR